MSPNPAPDHRPWLVWVALAIDPMTAAVVLATQQAIDLSGIEQVGAAALGGADTMTVDDTSGTELQELDVDLEGVAGSATGDGLPDRVIADGTDGDDAVTVAGGANGAVTVTGLAARLGITHAEGIDSLAVDTRAGHDTLDASGLAPNTIQLTTD